MENYVKSYLYKLGNYIRECATYKNIKLIYPAEGFASLKFNYINNVATLQIQLTKPNDYLADIMVVYSESAKHPRIIHNEVLTIKNIRSVEELNKVKEQLAKMVKLIETDNK